MRIGIDAHMVGAQETGNETYVKGLVDGFKAHSEDLDVIVYNLGAPWTPPYRHLRFQQLLTGNPYVRLGIELPLRSFREGLDVLHMSYVAPVWSAAPVVLTVHDICYTTNPEWFSPRELRVASTMVPPSIRKAAHVITDSQSARRQIIEHYSVPEAKISAIPIGPGRGAEPITLDDANRELAGLNFALQRPYLLAVGNVQPRKNLVRLVQAFGELVGRRGHDLELVIVGPPRFRAKEIVQAAEPVSERVHFTGYVTDRQLAACYRCSSVFVFPSLYEGFGLPVLEAMAHGIPVASSDAGALPEVCGDAALLFNPLSIDGMVTAVDNILSDTALQQRLGRAGMARAKELNWSRCAQLTLEAYEKARLEPLK